MSRERILIVGGGVSGLAAAGFLADRFDCLLVERESEIGGYCRTIYKDGFVWDYSGHFFHFQHKWVADYIHAKMDISRLLIINRKSRIYLRNQYVDFPFQFNIHQLPLPDFVRCLVDMHAAGQQQKNIYQSFREMVFSRYGESISELFLIPYNEKLYSVPSDRLDAEAMGRFFPHINFSKLLERIKASVDGTNIASNTYNNEFFYHQDGARAYADALASYVPKGIIRLSSTCEAIDIDCRRARISGENVAYDRLIISAPLPSILRLAGLPAPEDLLTANKVLVLNLGFDRPSLQPDHWVYYPEPDWVFFRIGHYDNILGQKRMSLYVEIAMAQQQEVDVDALLRRSIIDLQRAGVINGHTLVSWTAVMLDPAYVHITRQGQEFAKDVRATLMTRGIFPIGRYGRWTYCSIEDNIVEAFRLARDWGGASSIKAGGA
jgi:protoporphyrinogen oxidase